HGSNGNSARERARRRLLAIPTDLLPYRSDAVPPRADPTKARRPPARKTNPMVWVVTRNRTFSQAPADVMAPAIPPDTQKAITMQAITSGRDRGLRARPENFQAT